MSNDTIGIFELRLPDESPIWTYHPGTDLMAPIYNSLTDQMKSEAKEVARRSINEDRELGRRMTPYSEQCDWATLKNPPAIKILRGFEGEGAWHKEVGTVWRKKTKTFRQHDAYGAVQIKTTICHTEKIPDFYGNLVVDPVIHKIYDYYTVVVRSSISDNYKICGWKRGYDATNKKFFDQERGLYIVPFKYLEKNLTSLLRVIEIRKKRHSLPYHIEYL